MIKRKWRVQYTDDCRCGFKVKKFWTKTGAYYFQIRRKEKFPDYYVEVYRAPGL